MKPIESSPSETLHGEKQGPASSNDLNELRRLLLGPEQQQLFRLRERMDDPLIRAEELGRVLPDAISLRSAHDSKISRSLRPAIEETLKSSVRRNPRAIADAIFPILGPGIRKAIASTILGMIQSLNQMLNHSFSIKGLKWRFEALRTRRSFAEVILLHTLVYRVEQIFIIHRESGIVLQHVVSLETQAQDPDLVSGMLTAIQDFVNDSFNSGNNASLDTLRMGGDQSVWVEQGVHVFLAAVIRGTPPLGLRETFQELLSDLQKTFGERLESFQGDVAPFAILKERLEDLLKTRIRDAKTRISPLLVVIAVVALSGLSFWSYQSWQAHLAWQRYINQVNSEIGIVITDSGKRNGKYYISGLKDPMSIDPESLLSGFNMNSTGVVSTWTPYYALDNASVLKRIRHAIHPPDSVRLSLDNGELTAAGPAGHSWILDFKRRIWTIPGITAVDDSKLLDSDLHKLETARIRLEKTVFYFLLASSELEPGQEKEMRHLIDSVKDIQRLSILFDNPVHILIIGNTDASGNDQFNLNLSRARAEFLLRFLIESGINPSNVTTIGIGAKDNAPQDKSLKKNRANRMVTFKTFIQTAPKAYPDD